MMSGCGSVLWMAPEILLGSTCYTKAVDIWSVGCILGEMLCGKPIFPGSSTMNQLDKILEVTGKPTKEDVDSIQSPFATTMLDSLPPPRTKDLSSIFPNAEPEAIDLMKKCLQFNPSKRPSAKDILAHPYVAKFHDEKNEPRAPKPITIPVQDNKKYTNNEYRDMLYKEIAVKRKENSRRSGAAK